MVAGTALTLDANKRQPDQVCSVQSAADEGPPGMSCCSSPQKISGRKKSAALRFPSGGTLGTSW